MDIILVYHMNRQCSVLCTTLVHTKLWYCMYMDTNKQATSFRLSPRALERLKMMAKETGISQTAILETMILQEYVKKWWRKEEEGEGESHS